MLTIGQTQPINSTKDSSIEGLTPKIYQKTADNVTTVLSSDFVFKECKYQSRLPLHGEIKNFYWIEVEINNETFSSKKQLMKEPVEIKSIEPTDSTTRVVFRDPPNEANFYLVEFVFNPNTADPSVRTEMSNDVLFEGNEEAFIEILEGVHGDYDVRLGQLSANDYLFYTKFNKQVEENQGYEQDSDESGDPSQLFAVPPANLSGNISNLNTNKPILGNFTVLSIDHRQIRLNEQVKAN